MLIYYMEITKEYKQVVFKYYLLNILLVIIYGNRKLTIDAEIIDFVHITGTINIKED